MIEDYRVRIQENEVRVGRYQKELDRLSVVRLLVFVGSLALVFFVANERMSSLLLLIVPLCVSAFAFILIRYRRAARALRQYTLLREVNRQEVSRLENKLNGFSAGQKFIDRQHPYVADVDVFGQHSLFQLINRTTTESGEIKLAEWLCEPASAPAISERQKAVKELAEKIDWRQNFQVAGMPFINSKSNYEGLLNWNSQPARLLPNQGKYLVTAVLLAILAIAAAGIFVNHLIEILRLRSTFSIIYTIPLLFTLTLNGLLIRKLKPLSQEIVEYLNHNVTILTGYEALIGVIASENFTTRILRELQAVFSSGSYYAGSEIRRLRRILDVFMHRKSKDPIGGNTFYAIFNQFLLLDIHWILLTEKWRARNQQHLPGWAAAIGELEALSSLAGFTWSNPDYAFPVIGDASAPLYMRNLGHPLIRADKRICNDFQLERSGSVVMITGSNMAGKSTFLRTLGINLVLAFAGAPCCVTAAQVPPIRLFTSMRTQDNLEKGVSSFYAELMRIRQLLTMVESGEPVFFLLDEMFKGTNSEDRYKGGISLIKQLSDLNASGIISTHDLELARTASLHLPVINYSFNSRIEAHEMHFDYKLTVGLCSDFNASELMKRSGIKLL